MAPRQPKRVSDFIRAIKKKFRPDKIILFGSRARGDFLKESDYDFLIVSQTFAGVNFHERVVAALNCMKRAFPADIICLTPNEFNRKSREITIIRQAVAEGKILN